MDFNNVEIKDNFIIIKGVKNFKLPHVFECGQCFRWNKTVKNTYIGVAFGKLIEVEKKDNNLIIYNTTEEDFINIWANYFDLYRDYDEVKSILSKDELLEQAVNFGDGIRLLRQEPFEIVISFIISANNRIPMIKRAIDRISKRWGTEIQYSGEIYYSFPEIEKIEKVTVEELRECGIGFRADYIYKTVKLLLEKNNIDKIIASSDDQCHKNLQELPGIGPKVSDCIMLFSMGKYSAFPVDVWVKRAMQHFYLAPDVSLPKIREFGRDKFGVLSGFAQQYLFYYARENKII